MTLKQWRAKLKITQGQLAIAVNLSTVAISNYESGRHKPRHDSMLAICAALSTKAGKRIGLDDVSWSEEYVDGQ